MGICLRNMIGVELDPPRAAEECLRVENGVIAARGAEVSPRPGDEMIDCGGAVVMPGLVNGHMHLYSALAAGMPPPPQSPSNFHEILRFVWWRLDRALTPRANEFSALIGALDAVRCGTTTLIDHHASPSAIEGSLDRIEAGVAHVGLRAVLCYETTDRNGVRGRDAGLAENFRYLDRCHRMHTGQFCAMAGAHASFTCADDTLRNLAAMAQEFRTGVHIHAAEDPCDEQLTRSEYGATSLIERFERLGLLRANSIFAHCTHLGVPGYDRLAEAQASIAHNTRSNMNNAVGYTPLGRVRGPVILGTDGIGSDMFSESKTAWFKSCDGGAGLSPNAILRMLGASARRAGRALGVALGSLEPGSQADLVVTDYVPATPLTSENVAGHFLFAMGAHNVRDVMAAGRWLMRDRRIMTCDEAAIRTEAQGIARDLWKAMESISC